MNETTQKQREPRAASAKQLGEVVPPSTFAETILTQIFAQQLSSCNILCWLSAMVCFLSFGLTSQSDNLYIGVLLLGVPVMCATCPSPKQSEPGVAPVRNRQILSWAKASANVVLVLEHNGGAHSNPTEASKPISFARDGKKKKSPPSGTIERTLLNVKLPCVQ